MARAPDTTVVIITRNRCAAAIATVERLLALRDRPAIIVVDNGSCDGTAVAVRRAFPSIDVVALARNRAAAGRNVGVQRARTRYVAFADDDSWWAERSLVQAAAVFDAHPSLAAIQARILVGGEERLDPACEVMRDSALGTPEDLPGPRLLGFVSCGAIVRRDAFLAAGGFEERLGVGGEEHLLAVDLTASGWSLCYVDAIVAHHCPEVRGARPGRRAQLARNWLWAVWMRRSVRDAWRHTLNTARAAVRDGEVRQGLTAALGGAAWALSRRRPVPAIVEADLRRIGL